MYDVYKYTYYIIIIVLLIPI